MDIPESFDSSILTFWENAYESDNLEHLLSKLHEYTTKSESEGDYVEGFLSPCDLFIKNLEKELENYEKQIQFGYKNIQHFYIIENIQFLCVKYDNFLRSLTNKNYTKILNYFFPSKKNFECILVLWYFTILLSNINIKAYEMIRIFDETMKELHVK